MVHHDNAPDHEPTLTPTEAEVDLAKDPPPAVIPTSSGRSEDLLQPGEAGTLLTATEPDQMPIVCHDEREDWLGEEAAGVAAAREPTGFQLPERLAISGEIEAIIFAAPTPVKAYEILEVLQRDDLSVRQVGELAENLRRYYATRGGGFRLEYVASKGYQFQTVPAASALMERMFSERPRPLSRAAQETLAIIAYRQPVTRADIEFIRGVDAGSIIKNLLERELIHCTGRKEDAGRPMLFGTTEEFLKVYRLRSLGELPPLEAFQPASDTVKGALEKIGAAVPDVDAFVPSADSVEDASGADEIPGQP